MNNVIELTNVTKTYGRTLALNNISLNITSGKIIGLLGPNGSGKTTLLKTLMCIIRQQRGDVKICGESLSYKTRRFLSYMPDREFLYDSMTVNDAINYYKEMFPDFDLNRVDELCHKLNLDRNSIVERLSKGNKEKVVLMLTLSRMVPIYLLDEPLGSLDPLIKHEMLTVIKESIKPECLIMISTHLIRDTEEILDDVIFLKNGVIEKFVSKKEIEQEHKTLEQFYLEVFSNV
jgi:ABC-2 type transport system ATP-binding protein